MTTVPRTTVEPVVLADILEELFGPLTEAALEAA